MIYKFFDTSSLLLIDKSALLQEDYKIVISTITLQELETLKYKESRSYEARRTLKLLDKYHDRYETYIFKREMLNVIIDNGFDISNDSKILATAIAYDKEVHPDEVVFVTNDRALKHIANVFFGNDSIESYTR